MLVHTRLIHIIRVNNMVVAQIIACSSASVRLRESPVLEDMATNSKGEHTNSLKQMFQQLLEAPQPTKRHTYQRTTLCEWEVKVYSYTYIYIYIYIYIFMNMHLPPINNGSSSNMNASLQVEVSQEAVGTSASRCSCVHPRSW